MSDDYLDIDPWSGRPRIDDHGTTDHRGATIAIDQFLSDVAEAIPTAMEKFPQPNPTIAALTEEVGEAAQAALHIREGKSTDWWRVYDEAVQVAVMAARLAIEGDPTIGATPTEENCK